MTPSVEVVNYETIYGQYPTPVETSDLVQAKIEELHRELEKLPEADKRGWMKAQEKCPGLVKEDHKLKFLRCEVMNADRAAKRLAKYWETRLDLFGSNKAFLPLTIDEALKDDDVALNMGFMRIVPAMDPVGRGILFADPSRQDKLLYERKSMTRSIWYVVHAILQHETVQKKGIVLVVFPLNARMNQTDRTQMKMNIESIQGCLPIRVAAFHICHPPTFFALIFPIIKLFLSERMKQRMKVHAGSDEKVLKKLAKYGLTSEQLPTELGGDVSLDHKSWLIERKESGL